MIDWIVSSAGRSSTGYISVGVTPGGAKDYLQLSIRFTDAACKDLRLIEGDRVVVGVDKVSKQVCIKRVTVTSGSIKMAKAGGRSAKNGTLRVQCRSPFPRGDTIQIEKARVHIESTHIAIDVPELFK